MVQEQKWWKSGQTSSTEGPFEVFLVFFLIRIGSFSRTLRKVEDVSYLSKKTKNIIALVKLIYKIVMIAHLLACLWVKFAIIEQDREETSWMIR